MQHIKSFLSDIFRLADQQGYFEGANPVRETSAQDARGRGNPCIHLGGSLLMLDAVPEPASTMLATAAFTGVRRGERRGTFWENYKDGEFVIARSMWNGITKDPKSKKSRAPVPIVPKLAAHRKCSPILSRTAALACVGRIVFPDCHGELSEA
jgi:hypothetical protein